MGAETQRSRAADPAVAVVFSGKTNSTKYSTCTAQVYDVDGHRLPVRPRRLIPVAPRLASPGWYRLAADRWAEVVR